MDAEFIADVAVPDSYWTAQLYVTVPRELPPGQDESATARRQTQILLDTLEELTGAKLVLRSVGRLTR